MASLADAPDLVGFFSYSREDDEDSSGKLSKLRERIQAELRGQLGRTKVDFRLWQDKTAIAHGELWEDRIKTAIAESVFFIPIITPTAVRSRFCKFEFETFLAREKELGRSNLVFPILYIPVPALADDGWRQDPLLAIIGSRQYEQWQNLRHLDPSSTEVALRVEKLCENICKALQQPWLSPQERQEAEARRVAEAEHLRQEAEIKQRAAEERRRRKAEAEERRRDEDERRRQEAPPPVRGPFEEPGSVGSLSTPQAGAFAGDRPSWPRRLYVMIAIFVLLGVGGLAGAVYWSRNSQHDSRSDAPAEATVTAGPKATNEIMKDLDATPAPSKNVLNAAPPTPSNAAPPSPSKDAYAAAPTLTWRLQTSYPTKMATTLPLFVKRVSELSGDRMRLEQLSAGAVVPAFQLVDAVHSGALDLGYGQGSFFYGKHKAFALMTAVPFGFTTRDHLLFRRLPDTNAAFDELITGTLKLNVVAIPCGGFGRSGEFWLRRPLRSKADLVGQKLRFVGLAASIYTELGSTVTLLSVSEITQAINVGAIDGGQFANPTNDLDFGFAKVLKYYYYPSSVTPANVLDLYINRAKWDALTRTGRQIIGQACQEAVDAMITEQEKLDREALAELARQKVNVAALPATIERDIYVASEKVLTEDRRDPTFDKVMRIVDQMRASTLASKLR